MNILRFFYISSNQYKFSQCQPAMQQLCSYMLLIMLWRKYDWKCERKSIEIEVPSWAKSGRDESICNSVAKNCLFGIRLCSVKTVFSVLVPHHPNNNNGYRARTRCQKKCTLRTNFFDRGIIIILNKHFQCMMSWWSNGMNSIESISEVIPWYLMEFHDLVSWTEISSACCECQVACNTI